MSNLSDILIAQKLEQIESVNYSKDIMDEYKTYAINRHKQKVIDSIFKESRRDDHTGKRRDPKRN